MEEIIVGTEAVAAGIVTRHELQRWYRPLYRNVHAPKSRKLTLRDRAVGAWLWSSRKGVITGLAAAALHGSRWIDDGVDIELIHTYPRSPRGIITRNERLADDEWEQLHGLAVTTPVRTAFDLGRFQPDAVARMDALLRVRPYSPEDVTVLAKRYRGARGVARLKQALPRVDPGAQSPRETWWRILVTDCGFPAPTTQIPVCDQRGRLVRIVDFGWEDYNVALEYDGDQHQSDRGQYLKDRRVLPLLDRLGWKVIGVVKEDDPVMVIQTLHQAMTARGWRGRIQIPAYAYNRWRPETAATQRKFERGAAVMPFRRSA
ncbi:hypothetical protein NGTWS0302_29670 [Mycolicibacterium cyprinidarum]|uniref:DUF559 domain-containing protein n=1 Tax=Mycolicibacterium cyprinidarum TaxID=2860311 RepID=A0ABQ4V6J7_9MYCO|nr:hypothetical protein NGTWS1702_31400 [Mycolicibacterium sp. NGTWSNA01]GJF11802.1 hypothetical protein NGTWS0302_29670 [Mycolicibacterium sp. NGTWS0302]